VTGSTGTTLGDDRIARYARQLLVPGFGAAGQERLAAARVRVVGAGPAAGPALLCLVQAGVGRIWIEDPEMVSPPDLSAWLYPPAAVGAPRAEAARTSLEVRSRFVEIEPYPAGGVPTAALVCAPSAAQALSAAEASRRAGVSHVVADPDGEGGSVVAVPPGRPCYACNRSPEGAGRPPTAAAAAIGALAALELLQLIADPPGTGRRIDVVRGVALARPTGSLPGCACGEKAAGGGGA
jgi:adenylyltransferase/sulfurtransferase